MGFFFFLLLVGPLIFVHELGHFLAARRYGVLCEEFAIGFGPKVASWTPGETEYSLRALPLGGYVRMLGMFEETVEEEHKGRYLQEKTVWQRFVIYLAGPVMNLLIPIPIIFAVLLATEARFPPLVGALQADSPAMVAGLQPGDEIVAVDGRPIRFFDQLSSIVSRNPDVPLQVGVVRGDEFLTIEIVPERIRVRDDYVGLRWKERGRLGVMVGQYGPVLDVADPHSSAALAGLRTFDKVVAIDGSPIRTWDELRQRIEQAEPGREITLVVLRPETVHDTPLRLDRLAPTEVRWQIPPTDAAAELAPARGLVVDITPGSPADEAGFQIGDRILEVDGRRYGDVAHVLELVSGAPDEAHDIRIQRGAQTLVLALQARTIEVTGDFGYEHERTFVGLRGESSFVAPQVRPMRAFERLLHALKRAFLDTIGFIGAMILGVAYLVVGTVDSSSLGGPILIADLASRAGAEGMAPFLRMMALISINLGILNLLPIPGLDGGHLSILAVEAIKRGPLSPRTRQIINFVGFVMIVLLMIFVFKNDIERYWEDIRNWLNA